ncbi:MULTISPECIES: hypothetical protein [unclassified Bartonella]|uniref:hypothetical protein n=1 Tax=unclassified Bartonella TaxID=2645622 RepID=UPI0035CECACE
MLQPLPSSFPDGARKWYTESIEHSHLYAYEGVHTPSHILPTSSVATVFGI